MYLTRFLCVNWKSESVWQLKVVILYCLRESRVFFYFMKSEIRWYLKRILIKFVKIWLVSMAFYFLYSTEYVQIIESLTEWRGLPQVRLQKVYWVPKEASIVWEIKEAGVRHGRYLQVQCVLDRIITLQRSPCISPQDLCVLFHIQKEFCRFDQVKSVGSGRLSLDYPRGAQGNHKDLYKRHASRYKRE